MGAGFSYLDAAQVEQIYALNTQQIGYASLTIDRVKASVQQVVSLLAGPPERIDILLVGGKGLDAG
jgi:hypothetical protein